MSYTRPLVVIAFIAMLVMIIGCSGGSPVGLDKEAGTLDSIPVIGLSQVGDMFNAVGLLGAYEINIDPETMSAELVAKRTSSAIGDSFVISGLPFFTMTPCQNCVELTGVKLTSGGDAALSFAIRHPFKMGSMSLPPTAANRRDLDIFDVAAVIAPIGGTATAYTALGSIYDTICVGPAGYTKELANLFTPADAAAMPFFLIKDDSIDATPPVSTYNKFAMGASDNFDIVFDLGGGVLKFDMYLTFGYGAAAKGSDKPSFLAPKYFNPEFNRKNAWKVAVTPLTVPWFDNMPAEEKNIEVKVWDWQQGATVSTTTPYSDETVKTKVYEASNVTKVEIELFGDTGEALAATSGLGTPISPMVFDVTIANTLGRPAGDYIGLVKVFDSRTVAAAFTEGQDFLIDTPDGMALNNVLMTEFATYQTFDAEIIIGCGPIVLGTVTGCPVAPVSNNTNLNFTVTASSFMSTQISYEIDTDYDGVTFHALGPANTTGIFNMMNFTSSPCVVGDLFNVAVRMTDDCPTPNVEIFEICTVEIGSCCGPMDGSARFITTTCPQNISTGGSIAFVVGGVVSPNATITYYADYSYDGVTFNREASTTTGTFSPFAFPINGSYTVAFQAEDSCTPPGVYTFNITCTVNVATPTWHEWFHTAPANWYYGVYQYWSGCTELAATWSPNAPFGPQGAGGNVRYPFSGTGMAGGAVQTTVSAPFLIPSGYSEVNLRVYMAGSFGGSYTGYGGMNYKIAISTTPGLAPFDLTGAVGGGTVLDDTTAHGQTIPNSGFCGDYGQLWGQIGWDSNGAYGGGAFPGALSQYVDLVIPPLFYGQTVKVCYQWSPDWCGYPGTASGWVLDDWEIKTY